MGTQTSLKALPIPLACVLLAAVMASGTRPASAFGSRIHGRITRNALPFLDERILRTVVAGNLDEDEDEEADLAERHAQNCRFRDSATYINQRYAQVVDALRQPRADDPDRAARLFGHILHGVQDFYSHSNWIPSPPQGLGIRNRILDSGLGPWPVPAPYSLLFDDVVVVEGDAPAYVSARLPTDEVGRVSGAVPVVLDRRPPDVVEARARTHRPLPPSVFDPRTYRGLTTSGAPRHPGDQHCPLVAEACDVASPENVCLRHGDSRGAGTSSRNFDGAGRMNLDDGGGGDWAQARHHALLATRHEWCRLLHRARDIDPGYVAAGRVLGNWVARDSGDVTPHAPGTACARGAARRHLVEITATPAAGMPARSPFVVFRGDFTSSARTSVDRGDARTLRICGNTGEDVVAALVPAYAPGAVHVVRLDGMPLSRTVRDHQDGIDVTFSVKVHPDAC